MAKTWKQSRLQDAEWRARYLAGDMEAVRAMTLCSVILSSRVEGRPIATETGFPLGGDSDGAAVAFASFAAASQQKQIDLQNAEMRRQGAVGAAADVLRAWANYRED